MTIKKIVSSDEMRNYLNKVERYLQGFSGGMFLPPNITEVKRSHSSHWKYLGLSYPPIVDMKVVRYRGDIWLEYKKDETLYRYKVTGSDMQGILRL